MRFPGFSNNTVVTTSTYDVFKLQKKHSNKEFSDPTCRLLNVLLNYKEGMTMNNEWQLMSEFKPLGLVNLVSYCILNEGECPSEIPDKAAIPRQAWHLRLKIHSYANYDMNYPVYFCSPCIDTIVMLNTYAMQWYPWYVGIRRLAFSSYRRSVCV